MKICSKCKQSLPESNFWNDKYKKDGLRSACKVCNANNKEYLQKYYVENKEKIAKYQKENRETISLRNKDWLRQRPEKVKEYQIRERAKKYNLKPEELLSMIKTANGKCSACNKNTDFLVVDHNHQCFKRPPTCGGCTRGLICNNCNLILGKAQDSVELLKNLLSYLG